ncbi:cell division cycle protein-like protein [Tothia fuscella]|uniref:Cell division cycle protein-like protein n=1 Tax=Tothia fuscella TaxID=1048955 RepID=A0A9P4NLU0_9PEZI|nr:cell division cycle protein-like protein [Tothia fuscella]
MADSLHNNVLKGNASEIEVSEPLTRLPFPPLRKQHILNCSYHSWHPLYRKITPKARLVPLTAPFLDYLRADGIILPNEDEPSPVAWSDNDSGIESALETGDDTSSDEDEDVAAQWRDIHSAIKSTISELDGKVVPKLNWSAPKDATWISATNSMECNEAGEIYLLLKSSDFITHDLEHAFDDCEDEEGDEATPEIPYHLVLRKFVQLSPSLEFRCFVRRRQLIALCQRDLNHFDFLFSMQNKLKNRILDFFDGKLKSTFPDESFVFDIYIPPPHNRVWLIDMNPWAQRTDPLLFSWLELLTMDVPEEPTPKVVSIPLNGQAGQEREDKAEEGNLEESGVDSDAEDIFIPEFRLVRKDDPEAYGFSTPQYSAHKLPKDVVDASLGGQGQMREFAQQWKDMLAQKEREDVDSEAD